MEGDRKGKEEIQGREKDGRKEEKIEKLVKKQEEGNRERNNGKVLKRGRKKYREI